ncbi:hypothetical protein [Bacillus cereus]|uniref:hypothetical protein n=1 Tax=Bacillus cereus TaxID=1396 RepID=UPI00032F380C|nr:hypothetical protein [Bacillus cereus]EOP12920.1 hypothetical protein II1_03302 [Bacillus cereus MC118]
MLAVRRKITDSEVYVVDFIEFDMDSIERARDEFAKFKEKGIILNSFFEDNAWVVTNQVNTFTLKFNFSEVGFRKQLAKQNREMGTYADFVDAFKIFIVFKLNEFVLVTIKDFIWFTKKVTQNTSFFAHQKAKNWLTGLKAPMKQGPELLIEFLEFYPLQDTEEFIEALQLDQVLLDENTESGKDMNRRKLAEFQSYFYFDKLLDQFWEFSASDNEKLYFYPLYLFWKISNVLPLRVTEFTLIPRECLDKDNEGNYVLTIRRSSLKGRKRNTSIQHNLEDDYTLHDYPISNNIAAMIMDYKWMTEQYGTSELLLSWKAYHATTMLKHKNSRSIHLITKMISAENNLNKRINQNRLNRTLTTFYKEILQDRMNLRVLYKEDSRYNEDKPKVSSEDEPLNSKEIMKIQLGDTRHFALINMILNGVNPILVKDFAGHGSVNQSYHYFGHIDQFVKCISYDKFQEFRKTVISDEEVSFNQEITLGNIQLQLNQKNQPFKDVDGGKCFSPKFLENDITDCIKQTTTDIIGDCFNCDFFVSHNKEYKEVLNTRKADLEKKMNDDGNFLLKVIRNYKYTFKDEEVMTRTLLNIQQKANEYLKTEEKLQQTEGFK